jgi:protein-S-isoprenylcysteine O-methyltransferase Ste14
MIGRALARLTLLTALVAAVLFLAGGGLNYWQAWTFLAVFGLANVAITLYLKITDPALLERRMAGGPRAEKTTFQRGIQWTASVPFIALFLIAGLDHRFGMTKVSAPLAIIGDLVVMLGLLVVLFVFRENTFTSSIIEVAPDQRVIASGPYRLIRHPMYSGAIIMLVGIPLALASLAAFLAVGALITVIVVRLHDEELYLAGNLAGYDAYRARVRWRLIPWLW